MKRLVGFLVLSLLFALPSSVSAQQSERSIDIQISPPRDYILLDLAQSFADSLSKLSNQEVRVRYPDPPGLLFLRDLSGRFKNVDGSQLGLLSVDPIAHEAHFAELIDTVALLGRLDLALFVGEGSDIRKLDDFKDESGDIKTVGVHSAISQWSATQAFAELGVPMQTSLSYQLEEHIEMTRAGKLNAMVAPYIIMRSGLRPIALFAENPTDNLATAKSQGVNVTASYDYIVIAPSGLEQNAYESRNQDIGKMLEEGSELVDTMRELGLRVQYVEGSSYRELVANEFSALFNLQNTFCDTCDCEEEDCNRECPRCGE